MAGLQPVDSHPTEHQIKHGFMSRMEIMSSSIRLGLDPTTLAVNLCLARLWPQCLASISSIHRKRIIIFTAGCLPPHPHAQS